jgi:hypothetical protein
VNVREILRDFLMREYLLHGSSQKFEIVEPRQACDEKGRFQGNFKAVYATFDVRVAAFMATRHPTNLQSWSSYYHSVEDKFQAGGENVVLGPGYIYVLPGDTFQFVGTEEDREIVSFVPVVPAIVVRIGPEFVRSLDIEFCGALAER